MNEKKRLLYKAEEIAEMLQVSKDTVWRMGRTGELKTYRMGRLVRFFLPEGLEG